MAPRRRSCLLTTLIAAAMLGIAAAPVSAKPLDPQQNSLQAAADNFIACLKSETYAAATAAAKFARQNQGLIDEAKSGLAAQITGLSAALSGRKEQLTTLGEDVSAIWEALTETAVSSWAKVEQHAVSALDWVLGFMRNQSPPERRPEIPV